MTSPSSSTSDGPSYFGGHRWGEITREERVFCARLWELTRDDAQSFIKLVNVETSLGLDERASWDVGFEVCLYRDLSVHRRTTAKAQKLPPKRTFDLALFSEEAIVVVEAKAFLGFSTSQGHSFAQDRDLLADFTHLPKSSIHLLAIGSSKLFQRADGRAIATALEPFAKEGRVQRLTWKDLHVKYEEPLFERADELFGSRGSKSQKSKG